MREAPSTAEIVGAWLDEHMITFDHLASKLAQHIPAIISIPSPFSVTASENQVAAVLEDIAGRLQVDSGSFSPARGGPCQGRLEQLYRNSKDAGGEAPGKVLTRAVAEYEAGVARARPLSQEGRRGPTPPRPSRGGGPHAAATAPQPSLGVL